MSTEVVRQIFFLAVVFLGFVINNSILKKQRSTEYVEILNLQDKKSLEEEKLKQEQKYMWVVVDGVKEKVIFSIALSCSQVRVPRSNFCLSFQSRGEHPRLFLFLIDLFL